MPARLHRELIGTNVSQWLLFTHGIYGSGGNWRSIARKIHERRPEWGVVLVDLRQHGRSEPGDPPHTLEACAEDVRALFDELHGITVIAGHSFGGKVVLATRALAPTTLRQTWMFDASPSPRPGAETDPNNSVTRVLNLMRRLPKTWSKRDDFIAAITGAGEALPLAQWLAMNLVPETSGQLALRLDLDAVGDMLQDYYAQDLWPIALDPNLPGELDVVIADQSTTLSAEDRTRLAAAPPHVHVHHIDAGHWLHIEAPANVVALLTSALPTTLT
ncbi:MAG TPA: alpha/beta hydrolase [Kofleriaceae bacterium]|nr:alpha/beta hydrolase [Kofleriaceae bacterium]